METTLAPEIAVQQQSFLSYMFSALGMYAFLIPLVGLVCFVLALIVVIRGKGPMSAVFLILAALSPLMVGMLGCVQGCISSFLIIGQSGASPDPAYLAEAISLSMLSATVGILASFPTWVTVMIGTFFRSLSSKRKFDDLPPQD